MCKPTSYVGESRVWTVADGVDCTTVVSGPPHLPVITHLHHEVHDQHLAALPQTRTPTTRASATAPGSAAVPDLGRLFIHGAMGSRGGFIAMIRL